MTGRSDRGSTDGGAVACAKRTACGPCGRLLGHKDGCDPTVDETAVPRFATSDTEPSPPPSVDSLSDPDRDPDATHRP